MTRLSHLMISTESMEELLVKLKIWKSKMEKKGLRMTIDKKDYGVWH